LTLNAKEIQLFKIASTRDILVHEASEDSSTSAFRWLRQDQPITTLNIHSNYTAPTISGVEAILKTGERSKLLGQPGKSAVNKPILCSILLDGVRKIRIKSCTNVISQLVFEGASKQETMVAYENGDWREFELRADEVVVGLFGDSFRNFYGCFKRLGFIVGTTTI